MGQTAETRKALERDRHLCRYCLWKFNRPRHVFAYVAGYHPLAGGGHHLCGRARVDVADSIIGLCPEHHTQAEHYKIRPAELVALVSMIVGYSVYEKYRREFKFTEEEFAKYYDPQHREKLEIGTYFSPEDV